MNALTLVQLSQVALHAGMEMGFNAVGVERWCDPEDFHLRTNFVFGDQEQMRKPRLRTPCEWALSYSEEVACIRDPRQFEVPSELLEQSTDAIRAYFTARLLELQ